MDPKADSQPKSPDLAPATSPSGPVPDQPDAPAPVERPSEPTPSEKADPAPTDPVEPAPKGETPVAHSPAHIPRSPSPPKTSDAPVPASETPQTAPAAPATPAPAAPPPPSTPQTSGAPAPAPLAYPPTNVPLTMVQASPENGQALTARQLGQRARRARERELQAQGLYTPKRRTSSSATMPEQLPQSTPTQSQTQDVTMQSADEDGDDDGEGEPETDVVPPATGAAPAVPPHPASHLIPPIAVLAPATTPSRASLAQRARRERERQARLGGSPTASITGSPSAPTYVAPTTATQAIPFTPGGVQQPPTLTRGQLAQRARRARERVERASKAANSDGWTPSLGAQDGGISSAGEAVFAVAPPPNGTTSAFATTVSQTNPGYGVGLGAAHVPQQLNRAQLAQRARRARERQQRIAAAAAHVGAPMSDDGKGSTRDHRSPSSSVPPASPTAKHHLSDASRTSLSPMASSTTSGNAPAPLTIGAQFNQVFKSLTAGDNGVSRAVADAGALTSKDDIKGRNNSHSPVTTSKQDEVKDMDVDAPAEDVDQLVDEPPAPKADAPMSDAAPKETPAPKSDPPKSEAPAPAPAPVPVPVPVAEPQPNKLPTPEVHMTVQSVGA